MDLLPPTAPLDDFFAPVRRRHPDVDLVVLPEERPSPPRPVADDDAVARTRDQVRTAAEQFAAVVAPEADSGMVARLAYGPAEGTVVARCRLAAQSDGRPLDVLRARLERGGWRPRRIEGPIARLTGRRGDVHVRASYAAETGALVVEIVSDPLVVGHDRAKGLVRA